ncbi:DUF6801 domain-containing protein [Streptomyces boninensis]|uniref:DUF6801 domain-containing protein n=1 Tax=Streptomyces boninensis TaxID=2039455 RepID=UPI003B21B1DB
MKRFGLAAALTAGLLALGGGPAAADPVTVSQQYSCKFPILSNDPVKVTMSTDLPPTMTVGESVYASDIKMTLGLSRRFAQGAAVLGGTTIEGRATVGIRIPQPGGPDVNTGLTAGFPSLDLPRPAADFSVTDLTSIKPDPLVTWDRPGTAQFHALSLRLHDMVVRDASGNPVEALGNFSSACTLEAGQHTLFTTVDVLAKDGADGGQDLNTRVRPSGSNPGTLSMTQAGTAVALSEVEEGKGGLSTGALNAVTVKDDRDGNKGWSLTGKVSDFTGDEGAIPGENLSWTPSCDTAPGSPSTCEPGTEGKVGTAGATLATAKDADKTGGTFTMGAGLNLDVPATVKAGDYKSVLTLILA